MSNKEMSGRERIYMATVRIIGKEGVRALTTRKIAQEAGVNIAAINYYYGSKDKLVEEALNGTLKEMTDFPSDLLDVEALELPARLQAFFQGLMGSMLKYPGIPRAHLYAPLVENDFSTPFVRLFQDFLEDVHTKLTEKGVRVKVKDLDLRMAIIQMFSALVLPGMFPQMFEPFAQAKLKDPQVLKRYVAGLLDHYLE
jgi:AcrR family transcriptional regulator